MCWVQCTSFNHSILFKNVIASPNFELLQQLVAAVKNDFSRKKIFVSLATTVVILSCISKRSLDKISGKL